MNRDFIITGISRVIMVDKNEYKEKITAFGDRLYHHEIIFHFSGEATVYFDKKVLETKPNTVRFLPKGATEKYVVERKSVGECILVCFDTDVPVSAEAFVVDAPDAVGAIFKKIFARWTQKFDGYYFDCLSLLYKIFAELQKDNYIPEEHYAKIKPAIVFIENNFTAGKISAESLAGLCGISESYLKKLFVKRFGMPPMEYIIQMRINYACELLRTKLYTVTQTAHMCGYDNLNFFSRQFKKYAGMPPTEFKNKYVSSK